MRATPFIVFIAGVVMGGSALFGIYRANYSSGLAGFTVLTREDPLFYSGVFESGDFMQGLADLKASEEALMAVAIKNIEAGSDREDIYAPLLKNMELFPFDFLELLPQIQGQTDAFLKDSSEENADKLIALYDEAAQAYSASIDGKARALAQLKAHFSQDQLPVYFFTDSATDVDVAYEDFLVIQKNAEELKHEITQRKECLLGNINCKNLAKSADTSGILSALDAHFDGSGERDDFIRSTFPYPEQLEEAGGPYKISSQCWQSPDGTHWIYLLRYEKAPDLFRIVPKLATQNYYSKVPQNPSDPLNKELRRRGIDYYSQLEASSYECTDLTFYPELLTLDFLKGRIAQGSTARAALASDPAYTSLMANQFGLLGPVFSTIAVNLDLLTASQQANGSSVISPQFLLTTRSAYSMMYFPFARSVWRIDKHLSYFLAQGSDLRAGAGAQAVTLDRLLALGYSFADIKKFHINQRDIINSLIKR
jgi:hypothetical protein